MNMTMKERVTTALQHREPDRVPFDLAGTTVTGIHNVAYRNLLSHLGMDNRSTEIYDVITQQAKVDEDVLQRLKVDVRKTDAGQSTTPSSTGIKDEGRYRCFVDSFGIKWCIPKEGGLYYDMREHPLSGSIALEDIKRYPLPPLPDTTYLETVGKRARTLFAKTGCAFTLAGSGAGIFEYSSWVRGFKDFYMDLAYDPSTATALLDKLTDFKIRLWDMLLDKLGDLAQVALEADDLCTQQGPLISPDMYRKLIKPRHKKIFQFIKKRSPKAMYIFFHSCGAVYDLIPDLIETGVDILNPVQVSAAKMDTLTLKKEFDKDITFWGGGVDTQKILPFGTPQQVRDEVKKRVDDLAPGGGFVFATVHNIQADVPPENIMAMWETSQEYGKY